MTATLNPSVVRRSLADRRRAVIGYGAGMALMTLWVAAIYPSVQQELVDYVDAMPETMKSLFGIDDITNLAGFLYAEMLSLVGPLLFVALAITTGAATIAGEERDRQLSLVVATGVGRRNLLLSKLAALVGDLVALGAITFASLVAGSVIAGGGIAIADALAASVQLAGLGILFGTMALAVGAASGSKTVAVGVSIGVAVVSYLVDALANLVSWLEPMQKLSPFHWYAPGNPLVQGFSITGLALLGAMALLLAAAAASAFDRRDIGV